MVLFLQIDEGWWRGMCKGQFGLFPANYVQLNEWDAKFLTSGKVFTSIPCILTREKTKLVE